MLSKLKITEINSMAELEGSAQMLNQLKNKFTIQTRDMDGNIVPLEVYKERDGKLLVPRATIKNPLKYFKHLDYKDIDINFKGELRHYQKPLVENVFKSIEAGQLGGILKAGTGTGKSVIAINIICRLKKKACIIVPLSRIVEQWRDFILRFTDIDEDRIGYVWQNKIQYEDKDIVIAMLPSLSNRLDDRYPKDLFKQFYLTIWDEGHYLGAQSFSKVVPLFHDRYRLMLTATPRRKDGADKVFLYHIGNIVAEYSRTLLKPKILMVAMNSIETSGGNFRYRGKFNRGGYMSFIGNLLWRNRLIVKFIKKCVDKGRKIIVMSNRIAQLQTIEKLLRLDNITTSRFYAKWKDKSGQVILGTYGAMKEAVDIPEADTLVIATPQSDIEQAAGRILREHEGKRHPLIIDFVDTANKEMLASWKARRRFYNRIKAEIKIWRANHG